MKKGRNEVWILSKSRAKSRSNWSNLDCRTSSLVSIPLNKFPNRLDRPPNWLDSLTCTLVSLLVIFPFSLTFSWQIKNSLSSGSDLQDLLLEYELWCSVYSVWDWIYDGTLLEGEELGLGSEVKNHTMSICWAELYYKQYNIVRRLLCLDYYFDLGIKHNDHTHTHAQSLLSLATS